MELLAPAGSVEHFIAALAAGADAVYVGAPGFNARNPSKELRFDEIRAMAEMSRERGKSLYVALNSLVREADLIPLLRTLAELESIAPAGLIVQDLGVINLVRAHFDSLPLHGSTLMFAHNLSGVEMLARLGCRRVVLARELSLAEIESIAGKSPVEIEIFVHGAMCYAYSGTCLFSSFHGGKSGLRGNCVQPCRRRFDIGQTSRKGREGRGKSAYLFSMNDLEGIDFVDRLRRIGVAAIKIEGRLRSVNYVEHVVRAYRMVLDAAPAELTAAVQEARLLLERALGRKGGAGYFADNGATQLITSHHSGNIGTYIGRFRQLRSAGGRCYGTVAARQACLEGERFRLHFEASGERLSFTAREIRAEDDGAATFLLPPQLDRDQLRGAIDLYRVDVRETGETSDPHLYPKLARMPAPAAVARRIAEKVSRLSHAHGFGRRGDISSPAHPGPERKGWRAAELWLRLESVKTALQPLPFTVDRFVFAMDKRSLAEAGRLKTYMGREKHRVIWALPPVTHDRGYGTLEKEVRILIKSGFRAFQISSLGQMKMFQAERLFLYGDYSLNLMNSRAMQAATALGLAGFQFSIETDRSCLEEALAGYRQAAAGRAEKAHGQKRGGPGRAEVGLTVYGAPPLFISRATSPQLPDNGVIRSPKGEQYLVQKKGGLALTRPLRPFSLLPHRRELEQIGLDYLVVDLCGMNCGRKELAELAERLGGRDRLPRLPTFNYLGRLE